MSTSSVFRAAVTLVGLAVCSCTPAAADPCRVERVGDGDSFSCSDGRRVRLIGMDTPELAQGSIGTAARDALRRLLPRGGSVRLEYDVAARDRYGRVLAYVWSGNRLVNEVMVREGWALLYTVPPNVRYVRRLERAQREARRAGAGLWKRGGFDCPPADFRRGRCRGSG